MLSKRVLVVCLLAALGAGYYFFALFIPAAHAANAGRGLAGGYAYGNDLYPIWLTARALPHRIDPYTPAMEKQIEIGLYGRSLDRTRSSDAAVNYRGFSYPLYTDILAAPISALPFGAVQVVCSFLLPGLVALAVLCWLYAAGLELSPVHLSFAVLFTLSSGPVLEGIYAGQPTLLVAAAIAGATAALRHGRFTLAGVLLALASIKPHLILLLTAWLLLWSFSDWNRRKQFVIAFTASVSALFLASQLVRPGWWFSWWHNLTAYRQFTSPPLAQLLLGPVPALLLSLILLGLAGFASIRWRRYDADSSAFQLLTAFVLLITVIVICSSIAVYDQILILPALLWLYVHRERILRADRPLRILTILTLFALCWPWVSATAVAVASLFLAAARSRVAVLLPQLTASSLPFTVLSLMGFFVARALRQET